jgi:hypothetical protein
LGRCCPVFGGTSDGRCCPPLGLRGRCCPGLGSLGTLLSRPPSVVSWGLPS